jgi:predicted secreted protein
MKRLGLAVAAVVMSATVSFAQSNEVKLSKEPFMVNTEKLSSYLQLTPGQYGEVAEINAYFIEKQNESIKSSSKLQSKKMYQAVYGKFEINEKSPYSGTVSQIRCLVERYEQQQSFDGN